MEENKAFASFKLKAGKFAIISNVLLFVMFLASIGLSVLLFEYDTSSPLFWTKLRDSCLWLLVGIIGFIAVNMLLQFGFLKACGEKKIGIHVGLLIEVCSKAGMKRNLFFAYHFLSNFIPVAVAAILTVFFWSDYMFILLAAIFGNCLAYTPVYLFVYKQKKNSLLIIEKGFLNAYAETAEDRKESIKTDSAL